MGPAEAQFGCLGYARRGDITVDETQDVEILFLSREPAESAEPLVELVCPRSPHSPVAAFARESRFRIHHLCFCVRDIEATTAAARAHRITQVTPVVTAPAIDGCRIVFLFSRQTGLFELVERPAFR